ncbi:TetR/AcrR family transcriptional regulator [Kineococcus terrestris]|uniref:TetR/AcrR family transcriptional regulator n=1 Tax=Kineococcus terrestris TaxID=2044856 RepID=UPI0034DB0016
MARPRTVSDETVFDATARVVLRRGVQGTTLAAVAAEAGLSAAGLVQRFGSKRELLLAFSRRAEEASRSCFTACRSGAASPLDALRAALDLLTAGLHDRSDLANSLTFLQLDLTDPEFRSLAAANAGRVEAEIGELLREAVSVGELAATVDPDELARTVHLVHNGVLALWPLTGTRPLREELHAAVDAVLRPARTTDRDPEGENP